MKETSIIDNYLTQIVGMSEFDKGVSLRGISEDHRRRFFEIH